MSRKGYFIISAILFVLAIGLVVCGVLMFNALPDGYTAGTNSSTKHDLIGMGLCWCFILAFGCLAGAIGMLAAGLSYKGYDW